MASSMFKLYRNGLMNSQPARNFHSSTTRPGELRDLLKREPTATEERIFSVFKFSIVFFPSVYLGAWMTKKGYLNPEHQKKMDDASHSFVNSKKVEEKVSSLTGKIAETVTPDKKK